MAKCDCGNRQSCSGRYRFLALYDIIGDGVASLNWKRFRRCHKAQERMREQLKRADKIVKRGKYEREKFKTRDVRYHP